MQFLLESKANVNALNRVRCVAPARYCDSLSLQLTFGVRLRWCCDDDDDDDRWEMRRCTRPPGRALLTLRVRSSRPTPTCRSSMPTRRSPSTWRARTTSARRCSSTRATLVRVVHIDSSTSVNRKMLAFIHSLIHSFIRRLRGRAYLQRTMPMTRTKRTMTRIKSSRSSFDRCHCRVTSAAASASEREIEIPPLSLWTSSITRMLLPHVYCTHPRSPSLHFLAPAHSLSCLPHPSNPINHQSISLSLSLHTRSHSPIQQSRSLSRWQ